MAPAPATSPVVRLEDVDFPAKAVTSGKPRWVLIGGGGGGSRSGVPNRLLLARWRPDAAAGVAVVHELDCGSAAPQCVAMVSGRRINGAGAVGVVGLGNRCHVVEMTADGRLQLDTTSDNRPGLLCSDPPPVQGPRDLPPLVKCAVVVRNELFTGGSDGSVRIWPWPTGATPAARRILHTDAAGAGAGGGGGEVQDLDVTRNADAVCATSSEGRLHVWSCRGPAAATLDPPDPASPHQLRFRGCRWLPDGQHAVVGMWRRGRARERRPSHLALVQRLSGGKQLRIRAQARIHRDQPVSAVAVSPDGRWAAAGTVEGDVVVFSVHAASATVTEVHRAPGVASFVITGLVFAPPPSLAVLAVSPDRTVAAIPLPSADDQSWASVLLTLVWAGAWFVLVFALVWMYLSQFEEAQ